MPLGKYILVLAAVLVGACNGSSGANPTFNLLEFVQAGRDQMPRNEVLEFVFSAPLDPAQNLAERLKIRSRGADQALAAGTFVLSGERVTFLPRLPEQADRSDAGLRATTAYAVYVGTGPDGLRSVAGARMPETLEFFFETSAYFDDPMPAKPPRALDFRAAGTQANLSRLAPGADAVAKLSNAELLTEGRALEPTSSLRDFELLVDEPLDPATVTTDNVEMWEIRHDAFDGDDAAADDGDPVAYRVPIAVSLAQGYGAAGPVSTIRVHALQMLTDDARYRFSFRGNIRGLDYRQIFLGDNGLTGDGVTAAEPGGLGYVTEFLVYDRPGVTTDRPVLYEPPADGIFPEQGETTVDPGALNNALYDPPSVPSCAVGVLPAFGDGSDGHLAVRAGETLTLDTGATPNGFTGNPFTVGDPDAQDTYANSGLPTSETRSFDSREPTEWRFATLTVSSGGTLRIRGVNPARIRVNGTVTVAGTIDAGGEDGLQGTTGSLVRAGGAGGPGAFEGGEAQPGTKTCGYVYGSCSTFDEFLDLCVDAGRGYPFSKKGEGPGRGGQGGEYFTRYSHDDFAAPDLRHLTGTGGGGAGHAFAGQAGEDRHNKAGTPGTPGPACDHYHRFPNSGAIGLRGHGGADYGHVAAEDNLTGGSGGGAGGAVHMVTYSGVEASGGSGGGGGGMVEIYAAGSILVPGAIDVSGGNGGQGCHFITLTTRHHASGGGGGGSGGTLVLVSADRIDVTSATLDARGGMGGARAVDNTMCNAGGDGAPGYIFAMDADGVIDGLGLPAGDHPGFATGFLGLREFDADRFGDIRAVTQLFHVRAASPTYLPIVPADVDATLPNAGQEIRIFASSAKADADDPLRPDLATETEPVQIAVVRHVAGATKVTVFDGAMASLNPASDPDRRSFLRIRAVFTYGEEIEAATGPFSILDRVRPSFRFNE